MLIIGCDSHTCYEQIAMAEDSTGNCLWSGGSFLKKRRGTQTEVYATRSEVYDTERDGLIAGRYWFGLCWAYGERYWCDCLRLG